MIFYVRALPNRILSPNGGTRSEKRNGQDLIDAMYALSDAAYHALRESQEPPYETFNRAVIALTFCIKRGAQRCPRCRGVCQCYRPRTPSNFGGDIATPIRDALVKHDVIAGKTWQHVAEVRLRIRDAEETANEGILVEVSEAEAD